MRRRLRFLQFCRDSGSRVFRTYLLLQKWFTKLVEMKGLRKVLRVSWTAEKKQMSVFLTKME